MTNTEHTPGPIDEQCTRCLAPVTNPVWLIHRTSTGTYHTEEQAGREGWLHSDDDQGGFPFGSCCARIEAKEER